jgi:hypothetical protein
MTGYRDGEKPREKKSWREIDKARESGSRRETRDDRERHPPLNGNNSAYEKYKKDLERLWGNGRLGEITGAPQGKEESQEPQRAVIKKPQDDRLKERDAEENLRKAVGQLEVRRAVEALLEARSTLPNDFELLSKALASPSESHQQVALRALDERPELVGASKASLLKSRLQTVMLTASEDETRRLAQSVRARLG